MGDNLTEAAQYSTSAMADMDILLADTRLDAQAARPALMRVQNGAKSLSARAIIRASQRVIDGYDNANSQPKIDGRIMALYKLIVQYDRGLAEIMGGEKTQAMPANITLPAENIPTTPKTAPRDAQKTLVSLLPFAGEHRQILERLLELNEPIDVQAQAPITLSFESLMADVTNEALRLARTQGKSISLSYAAQGVELSEVQAEATRLALHATISRFISNKIDSPPTRRANGLPRSGHIDVSAQPTMNGMSSEPIIVVSCDGESIALDIEAPNINIATPSYDFSMELGV